MASVFVRRSPAPPRVWSLLMDYWQVPASLAVTWWRALGHSHHARALAVCQAVLLFDAAPVAEVYHLVYGVCAPQAVIEVLEALVEEGQLARSQATAIEEAVLGNVDRKANGGERDAALAGRVMECMDDSAGSGRSRGATDSDGDDAPGRGGMARSQTRDAAMV